MKIKWRHPLNYWMVNVQNRAWEEEQEKLEKEQKKCSESNASAEKL